MAENPKQKEILAMASEAQKGFDRYKDSFVALENGYENNISTEKLTELVAERKSHIAPKIIKSKVRKIVISTLKTYFDSEEFGVITPNPAFQNEMDSTTESLQNALNDWTTKRLNLYSRIKPVMIDGLVYGTPIQKIAWKDGLQVSRVKIKDLFLDPNADTIYDMQYCVHRMFTTVGKLSNQFGKKFDWKKYVGQKAISSTNDSPISTEFIGDATRIEIFDVYRFQDGAWLVSTILPDLAFVRTDVKLKDGLPFIIGNIDPQFRGINATDTVGGYGGSFIESMIPLQEEYTISRNKQLDAIDGQIYPAVYATKTSGLNEKELVKRSRKVTVSSLSDIRDIPTPNINQSIFNIDRLDGEMQEVSGVTKYNQGINDKKNLNQTATGISILTQEGNEVIEDMIRALNESFFEPMLARIVKLIYKYDDNPALYGINRSLDIAFTVSVNAGVGATNKELLVNNINLAEQTAMQLVKLHSELGDTEKAKLYSKAVDALFVEKMRALKLKTIIPIILGKESKYGKTNGLGSANIGTDNSIPRDGSTQEVGTGTAQPQTEQTEQVIG